MVIALLVLLAACDGVGAPALETGLVDVGINPISSHSTAVKITTKTLFRFEPGLIADVEIANVSDRVLYFDACGAVFIEELQAEEVIQTWQIRYLRCYLVTTFPAGTQRMITFTYDELAPHLVGARLDGTVHYRFRFWSFFEAPRLSPADQLERANQYSNPFRLVA